jgi:Outer membrane protein beta-barrel domain
MKKLYVLFLISLITYSVTNGQFTKVGGGLGYSTGFPFHEMPWDANKSGNFNVSLKGIYQLNLPIQISPSITYLFPHITKELSVGEETTTTVSTVMFDLNGHYVFNAPDRFEFYGLAGLDILLTGKKEAYSSPESINKETDNALGLNIGVGSNLKITEQISLYGEAKYIVSKYHQFMVNLGVLINLDGMKKNETPSK